MKSKLARICGRLRTCGGSITAMSSIVATSSLPEEAKDIPRVCAVLLLHHHQAQQEASDKVAHDVCQERGGAGQSGPSCCTAMLLKGGAKGRLTQQRHGRVEHGETAEESDGLNQKAQAREDATDDHAAAGRAGR